MTDNEQATIEKLKTEAAKIRAKTGVIEAKGDYHFLVTDISTAQTPGRD